MCGSLDDLFTDFRSWVIAHGQDAYERVVEEPDALAEFEDMDDVDAALRAAFPMLFARR